MHVLSTLIPQLGHIVQTLHHQLPIPGIAMSIVTPEDVVWQHHSGIANDVSHQVVTADTVFALASNTKAMTSMMLSKAQSDRRCDVHMPLRLVYDRRLFADDAAHQQATMRDLAGHVTGLPRHELVLFDAADRYDVVRRLPHLAANAPFRQRFQYQNLLYVVLGYVLEQLYALPYEQIMRRHLAEPCGLDIQWRGDAHTSLQAQGYQCDMQTATPVTPYTGALDNPAGGVMMSNRTLATWLQVLLRQGAPLITPALWHQLVTPVLGGDVGYAMGWDVQVDRGVKFIHHGGVIDGFQSEIAVWPDHGLALGVMTNQVGIPVPEMIRLVVHDYLCQQVKPDYMAYFAQRYTPVVPSVDATARAHQSVPSALQGVFWHAGYGELRVMADGLAYAGQTYPLHGTATDGWWANFRWGIRLRLLPIADGWRLESHAGTVSVADFVPRNGVSPRE
jgi:CubicO group peptidase (beta-lactamase class C family)